MKGVAKALRDALDIGPQDDATGIFVICTEVKERLCLLGQDIVPVKKLIDFVAGDVSQERQDAMQAQFAGKAKWREDYNIPYSDTTLEGVSG